VIAALLVPFPQVRPWPGASDVPEQLSVEMTKLNAAAGKAHLAIRAYRNTQALGRWAGASVRGDTTLTRVDRSVPPSLANEVREIVGRQWASLGTPLSAANAEVFVYVDSTTIPRSTNDSAGRSVLEPQRAIDVVFALPEATDGNRCVSLVRLHGTSSSYLATLRGQSVIGPCGFYAAFGKPGPLVNRWLATTDYRFASASDWDVARAPNTDANSRYDLNAPGSRCLTGEDAACAVALGLGAVIPALPTARLAGVVDPSIAAATRQAGAPLKVLGPAEGEFLADVARSLGPDRFGRFWHSSATPHAAFNDAASVDVSSWTRQWLSRTYGTTVRMPGLEAGELVWIVIAALLASVIATRPRQRVIGR
jgi:hypothetical protein